MFLLVYGYSGFCSRLADMDCDWIFLSFQISRWQFALQPQFSHKSKKSHQFSDFSSFFSYYKNEADNFQAFYKIEGKTTSLFTKAHQRLSLKRWIIGSSYEDVRKWEFLYSTIESINRYGSFADTCQFYLNLVWPFESARPHLNM